MVQRLRCAVCRGGAAASGRTCADNGKNTTMANGKRAGHYGWALFKDTGRGRGAGRDMVHVRYSHTLYEDAWQ